MEPFEVIIAPFDVYLAPVGEAWPAIDEAPAGNWALLGTNGSSNFAEDGVTVQHTQEFAEWGGLGSTGIQKVVRTQEGLTISLTLIDLSLEQYAKAMNDATVTDTAAGSGTAGYREIALRQGRTVSTFAMLVRGPSPYADSMNMQYQVGRVIQRGNPEVVYSKGEPAGLSFEFFALEDPGQAEEAKRFATLIAQDAAAL